MLAKHSRSKSFSLETKMKRLAAFSILCLLAPCAFAACEVNVKSATLLPFTRELLDHSRNLHSIAIGYGNVDPQEGMWLMSLAEPLSGVESNLDHLVDLIELRDGITGPENQRLILQSIRTSLATASKSAAIGKVFLLKSSSTIRNQTAASEIARAIPTLDSIAHLGDSCQMPGGAG